MTSENRGNRSSPEDNPLPNYPALFQQYIRRSVAAARQTVESNPAVLLTEVCERALHVLSFALLVPEAWPDTRDLLLLMAPHLEKAGHREDWIPYLVKGVQQSQTLGDNRATAELNIQLGFLYQLCNRFYDADQCFSNSAACFNELDDLKNKARAFNQQAFVAWLQGHYDKARRLANEALILLPEEDVRQATGYVVLGWLAFDGQNLTQAETYFAQALTLWKAQGEQRQIARRLRDLANVLQLQGRDEEAVILYEQAIGQFKEINDAFEQAVTKMNLGIFYLLHHQSEKAITLFTNAESVFRQVHDQLHLTIISNNLGIAYRELGQFDSAEAVLKRGIDLCCLLNRTDWLVTMIDEMGMTYLAAGRPSEALQQFQQALQQLEFMANEPSYQQLIETVAGHFQLALSQIQ